MTRRLALWMLLVPFVAVSLGGCAGTCTFRPDDARFTRQHVDGRTAVLTLRDGRAVRTVVLRMEADSVAWVDPLTTAVHATAVGDVVRITVRSPRLTVSRSVGRGALIGAVAGLVYGVAAGYESGRCAIFCLGTPTTDERIRGALAFGTVFGLSGAATGATYGTIGGALFPAEWDLVADGPPPAAPDTARAARPF